MENQDIIYSQKYADQSNITHAKIPMESLNGDIIQRFLALELKLEKLEKMIDELYYPRG